MVAPDAEADETDSAKSEDNETLSPDWLAGKNCQEMSGKAETREHGNVDLGLREIPKEALPEDWNAALAYGVGRLQSEERICGKKLRVQQAIGKNGADSGEKY